MKRAKDPLLRHTSLASDHPARRKAKLGLEQRFGDEARFIKAWFESPLKTGSVYPSGKVLSRAMANAVDPTLPGPIVELGPGTGPVTEALLQRGIDQDRLILLEFDPAFCKLLARRYPKAQVVQGDAYDLARSLAPVLAEKPAAIVSSLPLLTKPDGQRLALLEEAFALLQPRGVFVQFTYGIGSPVPRVDAQFAPAQFAGTVSPPIWLNFPPARVWTYRLATAGQTSRPSLDFIDKLKAGTDKLGDEWKQKRRRFQQEFQSRAEKAKAEIKLRTAKVKDGLERHSALRSREEHEHAAPFRKKVADRKRPHR